MFVSSDVTCETCSKVFCCKSCREKHEVKHSKKINVNEQFLIPYFNLCPICNQKPYLLNLEKLNENLISHIAEYHLPLHCLKCVKKFDHISDLTNHSKCLNISKANNQNIVEIKSFENMVSDKVESSTQTSPFVDIKNETNDMDLLFNCKFKINNKLFRNSLSAENISVKNVSCINSSSIKFKTDCKAKLVRTTSTPLQELFLKQQPGVFDSLSNEHVSSIYNSHSESDISPPIKPMILSPRTQIKEKFGNYQIARRNKKKPETPLRHVMSKSIRKALSKHGPFILNDDNSNTNFSQKILFKSGGSPLDLRTTPVLRRVHSEGTEKSATYEAFGSAKTSTRRFSVSSKTESILIKSQSSNLDTKSDTIYTTCRSIELITTELTEKSQSNGNIKNKNIKHLNSTLITPKCVGVPKSKKIINFKTPIPPAFEDDEVFYTPKSCNKSFKNKNKFNENFESENQLKCETIPTVSNEDNMKENSASGKIWSLVTSFVRIPSFSFKSDSDDNDLENQNAASSILKRCSSLKDYFIKSISPPAQNLKRKRTASSDITLLSNINNYIEIMEADEPKRPKRIHGRKPIERMRNNS